MFVLCIYSIECTTWYVVSVAACIIVTTTLFYVKNIHHFNSFWLDGVSEINTITFEIIIQLMNNVFYIGQFYLSEYVIRDVLFWLMLFKKTIIGKIVIISQKVWCEEYFQILFSFFCSFLVIIIVEVQNVIQTSSTWIWSIRISYFHYILHKQSQLIRLFDLIVKMWFEFTEHFAHLHLNQTQWLNQLSMTICPNYSEKKNTRKNQ